MNKLVESLIALSGQESIVVIRKPFVHFTGSLEAGLLLGQLLFWTPLARIPGQWIAKTDADFTDELCLSSYKVRKARKMLEDRKILQTTIRKFAGSPTVHYRLDLDELQKQWETWLSQMDFAKSQEPPCENAKTLTENTTEITTEDSKSGEAPPSSFHQWQDIIKDTKNRPAALREMFKVLYPDHDLPAFGYIGTTARKVGGAGRLAELLWQNSTRPPTGDVLAYIIKAKNGGSNGGNRRRSSQRTGHWTPEEIAAANAET